MSSRVRFGIFARWLRPAVLFVMVGLALLVTGRAPGQVSATTTSPFPTPVDNVLSLHMNTDGLAFRSYSGNPIPVNPTPAQSQAINVASNCTVALGSPGLIALTAIATKSPAVGFNTESGSYGLGVTEPGEGQGAPCGFVDSPDQQLILQLGSAYPSNFGITHFELDIEAKFGAILDADLYWGSTYLGTQELNTSTGAADSGADSKANDHYRWVRDISYCPNFPSDCLNSPFNKMVLRPVQGAFSLSAGAAGTHAGPLGTYLGITADSLFELSATITCGQTVSAGGGITPLATVLRGQNTDGGACHPKMYQLTTAAGGNSLPNNVDFAPTANGDHAQYFTDITWPAVTASYLATHQTLIDETNTGNFQPVVWCNGTETNPSLPSGHTWCRVERDEHLIGTDAIQVHERFYGQGDPAWDF